jgi:hypothetical protein
LFLRLPTINTFLISSTTNFENFSYFIIFQPSIPFLFRRLPAYITFLISSSSNFQKNFNLWSTNFENFSYFVVFNFQTFLISSSTNFENLSYFVIFQLSKPFWSSSKLAVSPSLASTVRRQRTTRRAVLRPPPPRLPACGRLKRCLPAGIQQDRCGEEGGLSANTQGGSWQPGGQFYAGRRRGWPPPRLAPRSAVMLL